MAPPPAPSFGEGPHGLPDAFVADEIIVAVSSPPGRAPRGLVRLSGHGAADLAGSLLEGLPPGWPPRVLSSARLALGVGFLPVLALRFAAPRSYTGEDVVELQTAGGAVLLDRLVDALLEAAERRGIVARRARAGEFTARAFLNGRMDLTQAEGVAATIAARSDAELRAARLLLSGRLGAEAAAWSARLAEALASVEAGIDFTDQEDVVAIAGDELRRRVEILEGEIRSTLEGSVGLERLQATPWIVLVGPPNAGKSSLFNALLGRERAVVSPIAGATRDALAAPILLPGPAGPIEAMLVDLPGLDERVASDAADDAPDTSRIEGGPVQENADLFAPLMKQAARSAIERATLRLRCLAPEHPLPSVDADELLVRTKADLTAAATGNQPAVLAAKGAAGLAASARTGAGLAELRKALAAALVGRAVSAAGEALALAPRQRDLLAAAAAALRQAVADLVDAAPGRPPEAPELVAASLRAALDRLGELTGAVTADDVLGLVFSRFCVGK